MVDVGDDGKITDVVLLHGFSTAGPGPAFLNKWFTVSFNCYKLVIMINYNKKGGQYAIGDGHQPRFTG